MSLDVYLETGEERRERCYHCEGTGIINSGREVAYRANITHNLSRMADAAGIYYELWRPEELGITRAGQLIEPLKTGLALLESDPARFAAFDSPNGWGRYVDFVPWVRKYLKACEENPNADVRTCR